MAKPRLEKVRALFYVLQHIQEDASNFDTPSSPETKRRGGSAGCCSASPSGQLKQPGLRRKEGAAQRVVARLR